jgi:hypothetical protein
VSPAADPAAAAVLARQAPAAAERPAGMAATAGLRPHRRLQRLTLAAVAAEERQAEAVAQVVAVLDRPPLAP